MRSARGATKRILAVLRDSHPNWVSIEDIARSAHIADWARRIRELRAVGWQIEYRYSPKSYRLVSLSRSERSVQGAALGAKQRYRILARDHSTCRRCGRTIDDGIKLVVDHILPREWGGSNDDSNLWTLCEECNLGKKAWQSDVDAQTMTALLKEPSGRKRLRRFFEMRPNQLITKEELQIVAGIGDYARRIRELRQEEGMKIMSHLDDKTLKSGEYRYVPG